MKFVTISLFGFLLVIAAICNSFCDGNSNVLCIESERQGLLKLKHDLIDHSNRLSSWVEGVDCCKWSGVICHNLTGHVNELHLAALSVPEYDAPDAEWEAYERSKLGGKINPSLLELKHLSVLDLSNNNFSGIQIPEFFSLMGSLTYLNLSQAQFQGAVPPNLGNLSKLHYLDLGGNWLVEARSLQWVSGLSSLRYLDLSNVHHRTANDWLQVTNKLASLLELHLSDCNLENDPSPISVNSTKLLAVLDLSWNYLSSVPKSIVSLHGLVSIDLSYNLLKGPIPDYFRNISCLEVLNLSLNSLNSSIPNWLYSLNHLQFLSLRFNNFQGKISSAIGNLSSVSDLDLSRNMLEGKLPSSLEDLCNLKVIDLSSNKIDQEISEILRSLSRCSLGSLEWLNMANNQLSGHLTDQLVKFRSLHYLSLSQNKISGPIPFLIGELSSLKFFDVSYNQINGTFPLSFGQLENLEVLYFRHNQLKGVVSEIHFSNLTRLRTLMASENMLRFEPNPNWIPPFHCGIIELGHWNLGPKFPQWLKFQKNLYALDISHAGIADVIPTWFWNLSTQFDYVNLCCNQLVGRISYLNVRTTVDLSSNRFTGPLPGTVPTLNYLSLSYNFFSGFLAEFVCDSSKELISVLHIDSNLLSGEIPDCWNLWLSLKVLNLRNNNLSGKIPHSLKYTNLKVLNLRKNSLFGELPSTLQNCNDLVFLDLSENQFSGSVPAWIGEKLSGLVVLSLRSNNFHGHIPDEICALHSLQNLDLGHNNISGGIPKCFSNLLAMATENKTSGFVELWIWTPVSYKIQLSALLVMKGREDEYTTTLGLVTSIELSANSLTGEIPKELGTLMGLRSLNLSGNLLTGNIPEGIGNMESLESLDLSLNQLCGEIPSSFTHLNFLNHFNLSYNNLTGPIPSSTQLQSFDNFSYMGNHLCGPPVTKNCSTKGVTTDVTNGSSSEGSNRWSKVNWLYVSIVLGFGMGFWGVVAPLLFIRSWRIAYYQKLNHVSSKLYEFWATMAV